MSIEVYDLIENTNYGNQYFQQAKQEIIQSQFKLKDNYLNIDLNEFFSFIVVAFEKKFVGFSGLQKRQESSQIARANTRLYISEHFRAEGLAKPSAHRLDLPIELQYPSAFIFLPQQLKVARQNKISSVFISRQYPNKKKSFQLVFDKMNSFLAPEDKFQFLDKIYNTCHSPENISCWQMIMLNCLNNDFSLFDFKNLFLNINYSEWEQKFK